MQCHFHIQLAILFEISCFQSIYPLDEVKKNQVIHFIQRSQIEHSSLPVLKSTSQLKLCSLNCNQSSMHLPLLEKISHLQGKDITVLQLAVILYVSVTISLMFWKTLANKLRIMICEMLTYLECRCRANTQVLWQAFNPHNCVCFKQKTPNVT